jgi:hypothetical protein
VILLFHDCHSNPGFGVFLPWLQMCHRHGVVNNRK